MGDSYIFSASSHLDFLYDVNLINQSRGGSGEYIRNLVKIAFSEKRQKFYFDLFHKRFNYKKTDFFKIKEYIWGYARILMWYMDFSDRSLIPDPEAIFQAITQECMGRDIQDNRNIPYVQDGLICLIYLLTLRETWQPDFIKKESLAYQQAKQLCHKLESRPIRSQQANVDGASLNEFLERLLDGEATAQDVRNMLEID